MLFLLWNLFRLFLVELKHTQFSVVIHVQLNETQEMKVYKIRKHEQDSIRYVHIRYLLFSFYEEKYC